MTIEQEEFDLQQAKEELNNIDYMFPYADSEYKEMARKAAQRRVDVLQLRVNRKKNIALNTAFQNEAMYEEDKARKMEDFANMSPLEKAGRATASTMLKIGGGVAKLPGHALQLGGFLERWRTGDKSGNDIQTAGEDWNQAIDDFIAEGTGFDSRMLGEGKSSLLNPSSWNGQDAIASTIRTVEGLQELKGGLWGLGKLGEAVGAGKYLSQAPQAVKTVGEGLLFGVQNIPEHSRYYEQTRGEFSPVRSITTGLASGQAMAWAFALGRGGLGMTESQAMNFARESVRKGTLDLTKDAFKQAARTALLNGSLNGVGASGLKEILASPENSTWEQKYEAFKRVIESAAHETIMGGIFGLQEGFNKNLSNRQTYRGMMERGKVLLGEKPAEARTFKETLKQVVKGNFKGVKETFSKIWSPEINDKAFDTGVNEYFFGKEGAKLRGNPEEAEKLFAGPKQNIDTFVEKVRENLPQDSVSLKDPGAVESALKAYKASLYIERNNTLLDRLAKDRGIDLNTIKEAYDKGNLKIKENGDVVGYLVGKIEDIKLELKNTNDTINKLDVTIKSKDVDLQAKQEAAQQKEEALLRQEELYRKAEMPYTRAEVIEAVRDMVNRKKANSPEQLNRVNELLARFLVKDRGNKPISVDDAIALLNEVEAELNNVGYSDYNADIENIVNPKLITNNTIYDRDERETPSLAIDNQYQEPLQIGYDNNVTLDDMRSIPASVMAYNRIGNPLPEDMRSEIANNSNKTSRPRMDMPETKEMPYPTKPKEQFPINDNIGDKVNRAEQSAFPTSVSSLDIPQAVAKEAPKTEPMAVEKESTPKPNVSEKPTGSKKPATEKSSAVQKTPVESKDIEAKYAKFVDLVNEFKKNKNEKLSKQEVIKLAKEAGLTKAEFIDLVNKSKEIKYNKPYAESMEDWENWKPSEKVRQFILNYGNTKEKPVTKKYSAELKTYNLDDSIDFDGNKTVKELVKDLSDSNSLVISGKSDGDNTTYEISKKKGKRKISVSKDVYDYAKGLEDKKAESTDDGFNGFLKGKQPFEKGAAKKALNKVTKYDGKTVKEVIDQLAEEGTLMTEVDTSKKGVKTFHVGASDPEGRWRFGEYFKGKTVYEYAEYMKSRMKKNNVPTEVREDADSSAPSAPRKTLSWEQRQEEAAKEIWGEDEPIGNKTVDDSSVSKTRLGGGRIKNYDVVYDSIPRIGDSYDRESRDIPAPVEAMMNLTRGGEWFADLEHEVLSGIPDNAIALIESLRKRIPLVYEKKFADKVINNLNKLEKMVESGDFKRGKIKPISLEELEAQPIKRMPQEDVESWREGRELYVADKRETEPSKQSKREYADITRNVAELYREGKITKEQRKYFYDNLKPEYDFNLDVNLKRLTDYQKEIVSREREKLRSSEAFLVQSLNKGLISFNDFVERRRKLSIDYHDSLWKSGILTNGIRRQIVDPNRHKPQLSRTKDKATNPVTDKELNNFLRGQAKQISKETGLNFKVVDSVDELRKMFPNNDITDTVEGGIHNDTVYLVRDNIDRDRLPLVIAHEVAGHRGVESLFENKQQMDNFFNSLERAAAKDKFIRDAFAEVDRLGYKENRSREAMAKIVEKVKNESGTLKGTAKTFVSFISSRVRRLLRRMGFKNLQLSEAEVYDIAVQALRRTGLKNSNKFFGLDRFLAKDNSFLSATSTELDQKYPGWSDRQTTSTGRHSTQAAITEKTYKKIGDWIINSNLKNSKILDASSGMGLGTEALRKMGLNVDDIEPYPGDRKIKPTYSGEDYLDYAEIYKKHGKTYDLIISNAVLNVIPDDWRKAQLHAMADVLLNKGGKLIINVRGDKEVANTKNKIILDSPNEILLPNSNGGYRAYQKGFSQKEFQDWVSKELGAGYKVEKLTPKNSGLSSSTTGVIVTKESGNGGKRTNPRYEEITKQLNSSQLKNRMSNDSAKPLTPLKTLQGTPINRFLAKDNSFLSATSTESSEREQLDKLAEKAGYNIKAYHGTDKEFDVFKPNNAQGWGKGIYFASEKSDAENYGKNVKEFYISLKNPFDPSDKKANEILDSKAPNTETYKKMAKRTGISDYVDLMNELSENNAEAYRKIIEESGFDGIKAYKSNDINGWEYVIFNPEQAKLADLKTFKDGKEVPLKDRFNKSKADIQFSIGERKPRKVKPDVVSEAEKKILDEIGEVKNPRDYNAVKKIAKNRMAEYKDVFSTKKNTGYKTSALKLHYLLGFDRKTQSVEKAFQSIRDFNTLQKTASAYARSIIGDKSTQANILDNIVKAKTFEKVYDIISKTNIAKEREIRKDLLDDFRNTIKELNPKKISTPTRMYTDEILGESFTPEELDSLVHSNEFTTKAVGKLRNIADNLASELGNIRKSDIEVSEYAINNAARLKHELNEIIKQRDAGNGAMNVPVEKLAEVNQLLKRFVNQDKLYKESLDTSAKNAAVADREQILSESPEKNPKTVNSRETNSIGRFKEYFLPGKALKTQDNENVAATMGKTMHKVAYENLLEGQNRQDHYRATGYKGVDRIMESFGKDLEDGREYLDKTAFKVKTSEGHEYEITNNEALAIIANYLDRETGQMIKKAGKVNFYLGEKKDSDYFTFTRKELDDMVNKLTPKQKKAIEDGFALLSNDFLPELNRVYEKLNGVPLRLIQGRYFPRMHVDVTQSGSNGLITKDRAPYIHQQMNADYQGILKQRDDKATPNLNLRGFTDTLQNYTDQASLYIGMAEPLRHLNRIMNGQMKRELTARYGAEYVNRINQMISLMAGMAGKTEVDKGFATRYLSNLAAAKLTPLSAIKQLTSVPLASSVIPAEYLAKAAISGMSNENVKEMMELDGMVLRYRSNGIAGIIPVNAKTWGRERIQGEKFKGQKLIDKAVGVGLNLSLMADKRALGIIYKATKLWAESQGKGSDKAWIENKFMEAVRRTQNTTDLASATGWQMDSRESGTMAFLNMYLNQTQKVSNEFFRNKRLMDEAAKKYGKDSAQYKEARNRTATFAASAALMEAMMLAIGSGASMLFKGKDEDSIKDKAVTAVSDLTGNPLLKPMINAYSLQGVLKGKKPTNAAVFGDDFSGMIPEITYTMGRVMNDLQSDDPAARKFRKLSYDMLSSKAAETSLALGRVPTWFARYPAKFIKRIWGEDLKNTRQKPSTSSSSGSSRLFSGKRMFGNSRTFGGKRMF